ncbi:oxidase ustYa family protein [Aspergillus fijiensis CBS 313.89]|uniref:Tat pathway signal sequence n=1 Tax=Aspergillus fijiensis CBS 313.89 TaxID=1448319 RepID=A0A8G1VWQ3_9EURO|nr:uncharacterized protein BO72DRAFT_530156 [Aspergillus fijiensis CBS 313.89]RAK74446.1 hypothetical protein BO72DRAFT_530156 [Aspergillus fijiensis CBS 313.89]
MHETELTDFKSHQRSLRASSARPGRTAPWMQNVLFLVLHLALATTWIITLFYHNRLSVFFDPPVHPSRPWKGSGFNFEHCPAMSHDDPLPDAHHGADTGGAGEASGLQEFEFASASEAVEYVPYRFEQSRWTGEPSEDTSPYEGPPTGAVNLQWRHLVDVGILALNPEQEASLLEPTMPATVNDSTALIQLDVFHQLHCLNSIRKYVYQPVDWRNDNTTDQAAVKYIVHINHCIEYLRQALMCHSDLSVIVHSPRVPHPGPEYPIWKANFSTQHTCRNFWKIHEWAKQYNTSGFEIERWHDAEFA